MYIRKLIDLHLDVFMSLWKYEIAIIFYYDRHVRLGNYGILLPILFRKVFAYSDCRLHVNVKGLQLGAIPP